MKVAHTLVLMITWTLVVLCRADGVQSLNEGGSWMQKLADETPIGGVSLIGTHDSGALHGGGYAECQEYTLSEQLAMGVRFLDIRCKLVRGELKIFHGIADQKMTFDQVRDSCRQFLKKHPSETILMSVKYESNKAPEKGSFGEAFKNSLQGCSKSFHQELEKRVNGVLILPSLGEVRGKVVIITRNREIRGISWSAFQIQDAYKLRGKSALADKWTAFLKHHERMSQPSINFLSASGFLFPPKRNAEHLNPKLKEYFKKCIAAKEASYFGIVVVDYVDSELCKLMMEVNQQHLKSP